MKLKMNLLWRVVLLGLWCTRKQRNFGVLAGGGRERRDEIMLRAAHFDQDLLRQARATGGPSSGPRDAAASSPTHLPLTNCGGSDSEPKYDSPGKPPARLLRAQQQDEPRGIPSASTYPFFSTKKPPQGPPSTTMMAEDINEAARDTVEDDARRDFARNVEKSPKARKTVHFVLPSGSEPSNSPSALANGRGSSSLLQLKRPRAVALPDSGSSSVSPAIIDGERDEVPSPRRKRLQESAKARECEEAAAFIRRWLRAAALAAPQLVAVPEYWTNESNDDYAARCAEAVPRHLPRQSTPGPSSSSSSSRSSTPSGAASSSSSSSYIAMEMGSVCGGPWAKANDMPPALMALKADSSDKLPWDHPCLGG